MVERTTGRSKLTPQVQQRLAELAAEARRLVFGEAGCPVWGTLFAEIENDAKEVGHEFIRLLMQQSAEGQAETLPTEAMRSESGELAQSVGAEERTIETESGEVTWNEPKAYLPKSRKAFSPQSKALGLRIDEDLSPAVMRKSVHLATKLRSFESAQQSIAETIEVKLTTKRVERLTERIGRATPRQKRCWSFIATGCVGRPAGH